MHSQFFDGRESIPAEERKIGYIVVTADKGLAGAYNHNVIKATERTVKKTGKTQIIRTWRSWKTVLCQEGRN